MISQSINLIEPGDYVRLAPDVVATHDSQTVYGSSRGVGSARRSNYGQILVVWRAGLLSGGDERYHFDKDLVKLTVEECADHDKWIKGD